MRLLPRLRLSFWSALGLLHRPSLDDCGPDPPSNWSRLNPAQPLAGCCRSAASLGYCSPVIRSKSMVEPVQPNGPSAAQRTWLAWWHQTPLYLRILGACLVGVLVGVVLRELESLAKSSANS